MFLSCMIFLHFIDEKAVIATCFCEWLLIKYYYYYYYYYYYLGRHLSTFVTYIYFSFV